MKLEVITQLRERIGAVLDDYDAYERMRRLAAKPCKACANGDHTRCENLTANHGAVFSEDFIIVCVCTDCDER